MKVTPIEDLAEFFSKIAEDRDEADTRVEPWQAEMKAGDHFVRIVDMDGPLAIFGVIEEVHYEEDRELYALPHMRYFRSSRCYSVMCPEGELGDTHVSAMMKKLSPTQFELAKEMGWPSDHRVRQIVELS